MGFFGGNTGSGGSAPTIIGVSPSLGGIAGGTSVVISGTNLSNVSNVYFGATAASSFTVNSATQITAVSPVHTAATVDITVVAPSATGSVDHFTYPAAPTVTSVAPNIGTTAGGTAVYVFGTNFTGATAVKFGTASATAVNVISSTQISCVSPAVVAGAIDVTVITPGGTSSTSSADHFTFSSTNIVSDAAANCTTLNNYYTASTGATLSIDTTQQHYPTAVEAVVVATNDAGWNLGNWGGSSPYRWAVSPSTQYTFSTIMWGAVGGETVYFQMVEYNSGGSSVSWDDSTAVTLTTTPTRYTYTKTTNSAAANVILEVHTSSSETVTFETATVRLEAGATATP